MVEEGRCPQCLKKGVTSQLLELESPTGTLKNLCSNPMCRYPFSDYNALSASSKLKPPLENVSRAVNSVASEGTDMDNFLNELFGCSSQEPEIPRNPPDHIDIPRRPHGIEQRSQSSIVSPSRITSLNLSEKSDAFEADLQSIHGSLHSEPRNITGNCMLPRYLADNIKRATSNSSAAAYHRSSPVPHKYTQIRDADGSCDSGISVTSVSTHASTPVTYGEYVYERSSRSDIVSSSNLNNQNNSKPSCSVPLSTETDRPILRVQRMIQFHKKRFDSLLG